MAAYNKFQDYVDQVNRGVHNWASHSFKLALSNTAPAATNTIFANITEISGGNGYTAGGHTLDTVTLAEATGTAKVTIADEVITASGAVGPFRYVIIYNDTATSPADALVCWYDYGSSVTLANGETFTIDFDATNGLWQMV
jgi:hypothetical protein